MTALPVAGQAAAVAPRWRRMVGPGAVIGGLTLATVALHLRDPHQQGSWGVCPLYAATGWYCPGCGGLRAVNDLTDAHVGAALSSNIVVTLLIPVATLALAGWAVQRWRGRRHEIRWEHQQPYLFAFLGLLVLFTVVRNLAFGAWLAP